MNLPFAAGDLEKLSFAQWADSVTGKPKSELLREGAAVHLYHSNLTISSFCVYNISHSKVWKLTARDAHASLFCHLIPSVCPSVSKRINCPPKDGWLLRSFIRRFIFCTGAIQRALTLFHQVPDLRLHKETACPFSLSGISHGIGADQGNSSPRQIAELLRQKFFRFFGMEAVNVDLLCAEGSPKPLRGSVLEPGINVGNILPFIQPALIQAFARTESVPEVLEIVEKH